MDTITSADPYFSRSATAFRFTLIKSSGETVRMYRAIETPGLSSGRQCRTCFLVSSMSAAGRRDRVRPGAGRLRRGARATVGRLNATSSDEGEERSHG